MALRVSRRKGDFLPAWRMFLFGAAFLGGPVARATPEPIPAPPIPAPPQIGPTPHVTLPPIKPVERPDIETPGPPEFQRMLIPPAAAITPAAANDPVPPPPSGRETPPPPVVSPGASDSHIEELVFALDPGATAAPASVDPTLRRIARDMTADPAARLEIRTFSALKAHSESTARRLSLARFLAVRDSLKQYGVAEGRVDGRPFAAEPTDAQPDRVELYLER